VADSGDAVAPGDAPLPQDSQSYQHNVDPMESLPRLAAVIERQRRELALARADGQAADLAAMARGVLMERDGLTATTAARQLADMSAAAGIPVTEMAAAVLRQEPLSSPGLRPSELLEPPWPADSGDQALTAGERPDPADDPLAVAAAVRSRDGAELVGALAGQLAPRFGVSAVAVWLLEADGALELLGADGLSGTDSSRWRRLPPQLDCPEQRVAATATDLWWESGPPPGDPVAVAAPWGHGAARAVLGLWDRAGTLIGVAEAWWGTSRREFDADTRDRLSAVVAGFADVLGVRLGSGPIGSVSPSPVVFATLAQITDSALVVRPLRGARGEVTDFAIVYLSPGYADPAGRPAAEIAPLTLLEAYPRSTSGDGLFARALRVLASGRAEHAPGLVTAPLADGGNLADGANTAVLADLHAVPFFAGVLFTWRVPGEAELVAEVLEHAQRLGSLGGWEELFAAGTVRWTRDAFALFGLDPAQASPIPIEALHSFVIAADRAPVRRFQEQLLQRREPAVAVFRVVRPGTSVIRQLRVFAEPVLAGDTLVALRGAFQDVSVQYHTQVALAATRDQLADSEQRAAEEHQLALRLQQAIMAQDEPPVDAAGVDVAVRYRPAEAGHLVGGDWYDVLPLPDNDILLVVGDITGHGIDAVTGMIAARNALRGLAATGAGPAELLRHLNYAACHLTEGIAGTVVCGKYEPRTRMLRWARAGHLPPVLVRDGKGQALPLPEGVLLGLDPTARYEEASTQLRVDDTLLLFTDGLIERRSGSISDLLREFTQAAAPAGPNARSHADRILGSALSDTGDDACLVVVRIQLSGRRRRRGMSGDQQEGVKDAPPVRFGEVPAHRLRERRQGGHKLGGEVLGVQLERRGDGRGRLAESGGASEPDQRGGHFG
jgi:serine phosphatase RsbU (regulator of sigma subunit)